MLHFALPPHVLLLCYILVSLWTIFPLIFFIFFPFVFLPCFWFLLFILQFSNPSQLCISFTPVIFLCFMYSLLLIYLIFLLLFFLLINTFLETWTMTTENKRILLEIHIRWLGFHYYCQSYRSSRKPYFLKQYLLLPVPNMNRRIAYNKIRKTISTTSCSGYEQNKCCIMTKGKFFISKHVFA